MFSLEYDGLLDRKYCAKNAIDKVDHLFNIICEKTSFIHLFSSSNIKLM